MSKAYLVAKNFTWPEMMNLICYGAKHPETLSQTQRITRLYRATIRRHYTAQFENFRSSQERFHDQMQAASKDFYRLQEINDKYGNASQAEKVEFESLIKKWVDWHEFNYDAFLYVDECRPYSPLSGRYYTFSNEELAHDPLGYYKPRKVSEAQANQHFPFFKDFPYNETHWMLPESFPAGFDDAQTEKRLKK